MSFGNCFLMRKASGVTIWINEFDIQANDLFRSLGKHVYRPWHSFVKKRPVSQYPKQEGHQGLCPHNHPAVNSEIRRGPKLHILTKAIGSQYDLL